MEVVLSLYISGRDWAFLYSFSYLTDIHLAPPGSECTAVDETDLFSTLWNSRVQWGRVGQLSQSWETEYCCHDGRFLLWVLAAAHPDSTPAPSSGLSPEDGSVMMLNKHL